MSPKELQGNYAIALRRIVGEEVADRYKPICQRDSGPTEHDAIEDAAKALRALWKLRSPVVR